MFIDDFIDFIHFAISRFDELPQNINVGIGSDYTIKEYYDEIINLIEYEGSYEYDQDSNKQPVVHVAHI